MSVTLLTGLPGMGKTALVCKMLMDDFKDRPLMVMGIPDLLIEHTPCPPVSEWTEMRPDPDDATLVLPYFRFPENSVIVIDEAQRVYRPRQVGSRVPPETAAFETHRHTGVDFILITQKASQIDSHVRGLIGRHIHIRQTIFGRYLHEWPELGEPENRASRETSARVKYKLPKKVFGMYKSAQLHTKIKMRLPWFVYLFMAAVPLFLGLAYYAYQRVATKTTAPAPMAKPAQAAPVAPGATAIGPVGLVPPLVLDDPIKYKAAFKPRIEGQAHTAPIYDSMVQPVEPPVPVGCAEMHGECKCIDQQSNSYKTTPEFCRTFIKDGFFVYWKSARPVESLRVASASVPLDRSRPAEFQGVAPDRGYMTPGPVRTQ